MGGRSLIPVSRTVRLAAAVQGGDCVTVALDLDTAPRVVNVPADLEAAMASSPASRRAFDRLSHSARHRYVYDIERARTPETRQRRLRTILDALLTSA